MTLPWTYGTGAKLEFLKLKMVTNKPFDWDVQYL